MRLRSALLVWDADSVLPKERVKGRRNVGRQMDIFLRECRIMVEEMLELPPPMPAEMAALITPAGPSRSSKGRGGSLGLLPLWDRLYGETVCECVNSGLVAGGGGAALTTLLGQHRTKIIVLCTADSLLGKDLSSLGKLRRMPCVEVQVHASTTENRQTLTRMV